MLATVLGAGTLYSAIENPEVMVNSVMNFLTVCLLLYRERRFKKDIEPKVNTVVERTEHLDEWDGETERRES